MSNKIRAHFKSEVDALLPILHETYRLIGLFQSDRNRRNERELLGQLDQVGQRLAFFKPLLQIPKQPYFDAVLERDLPISDRIIALDTAVGAMHIEFAMPRAYMHRESQALRQVLEASRHNAADDVREVETANDALLSGLAASPGIATGKAFLVRKNADYRRLPSGSIIVAEMTRPELVAQIGKVAGIVTDHGGSLCHAAILAREYGLPCIVGTRQATALIRSKNLLRINGSSGQIHKLR